MTVPLAYLVGSLCYGLATGFAIRFSDRVSVSTAAALAPAVAWSGLASKMPQPLLFLAPVIAAAVLIARRRPLREPLVHLVLFAVTLLVVGAFRAVGVRDALAPALIAGALYLIGDVVTQAGSAIARALPPEGERRTWWLLQGVLTCSCGLTALGVQELDWPVFAAMALVLVLTRHEFEAFAKSRTTFEQTVRAVEKLRSRDEGMSAGSTGAK